MTAVSDVSKQASATSATASALHNLSESALGYATEKASQKVDEWGGRVKPAMASGGATEGAGYESVLALLGGKNPVLAAIRGGWRGASGKLRVAVVLLLLAVLALAPVILLLLALGLTVAVAVGAVRAAAGDAM